MANESIRAAFERMWQHTTTALSNKASGVLNQAKEYTDSQRLAWAESTQTELLPETVITISENICNHDDVIGLQNGKNYIVKFDNTEYECKCFELDDNGNIIPCLGNSVILGLASDTNEPFLIADNTVDNVFMVAVTLDDGEYSLSITELVESVHKIDEKFLPETTWDTLGLDNEEIFNETVSGFSSTGYIAKDGIMFSLVEGKEYEVIWDGVRYVTKCMSTDVTNGFDPTVVGNCLFIGDFIEGIDSGLPFLIGVTKYFDDGSYQSAITAFDYVNGGNDISTDTHSVIIRKHNVNKIPTEYYERLAWVDYVEGEIFPETTISIADTQYMQEGLVGLQDGCSYVVNWNGTEYKCKCAIVTAGETTAALIGNLGLMGVSNDTGEPFIIMDMINDNMSVFASPFGDGDYTVSVDALIEDVHKIDVKFLPEVDKVTWDSIGLAQEEIFNQTLSGFVDENNLASGYIHHGYGMISTTLDRFNLVEGQEYEIIWDGVSYFYVCKIIDENRLILGHNNVANEGGYPFVITTYTNSTLIIFSAFTEDGKLDATTDTHSVIIKTHHGVTVIPAEYIPNAIPKIETAEVGQTLVVKSVDENGKPTEWEAVDMPAQTGGCSLPFVKMESHYEVGNYVSEQDSAALTAAAESGLPIIIEFPLGESENSMVYTCVFYKYKYNRTDTAYNYATETTDSAYCISNNGDGWAWAFPD